MIESPDLLTPGTFIVCVRGPLIDVRTEFGGHKIESVRSIEELLVEVLALSLPVMLVRTYPMPSADKASDHTPFTTTINWTWCHWNVASKRYVREYLKAVGLRRTRPKGRPSSQLAVDEAHRQTELERMWKVTKTWQREEHDDRPRGW